MTELTFDSNMNLPTHGYVLQSDRETVVSIQGELSGKHTLCVQKTIGDHVEVAIQCVPAEDRLEKINIFKKVIGTIVALIVPFGMDYDFDFYRYTLKYSLCIDSAKPECSITVSGRKKLQPAAIHVSCKGCHIAAKEEQSDKDFDFLFGMFSDYFKLNAIRTLFCTVLLAALAGVGIYFRTVTTVVFPVILIAFVLWGYFYHNQKLFQMLQAAVVG